MKNLILFKNFIVESRRKFHIDIPREILKIKDIFVNNGFKLYVVGGSVRDALLGKKPKDYDLATDAKPNQVINMLKDDYKILETGKAFGVINVIVGPEEYEIATFREDIGKGRRPEAVKFTTIDQDVKRRDLTINALFYDIDTKEIVDLVGGIEDLKKGIVKTVGRAEDRFDEDRLRILRAIRFAGRFGSDLDPGVDKALKKDSSLKGISGERIRDEFLKGIRSAKSTVHFLEMIEKYDLFKWIFNGLEVERDFIEEENPEILIAYLLRNNEISKIKKILNELNYSNEEVTKIAYLVSLLRLNKNTSYKLKKAQANSRASDEEIRRFAELNDLDKRLIDAFLKFKLSVSGQEIMDAGFKGAEIGEEIERREIENFKKLL